MTLAAQVPLEEALATNSWYSPDLKLAAFLGADGRMCVIVNGAPSYLYPNLPEAAHERGETDGPVAALDPS